MISNLKLFKDDTSMHFITLQSFLRCSTCTPDRRTCSAFLSCRSDPSLPPLQKCCCYCPIQTVVIFSFTKDNLVQTVGNTTTLHLKQSNTAVSDLTRNPDQQRKHVHNPRAESSGNLSSCLQINHELMENTQIL